MKAQFKNIQFTSKEDFKEWLTKNTHVKLVFAGQQDMQEMYLHKSGEVLHCDFQAHLYNGAFVNMEALDHFVPVQIRSHLTRPHVEWDIMGGLIIDDIVR